MSRRDRVLGRAAPACGIVGAGLMLAVDAGLAQVAGVLLLAAFIVLGTLRIASPEYLDRDDDPGD